jgi:hypothetical protein
MDRRIALKNMGMALGYTVAAPTIISLMQSCAQDTSPEWTPAFFSPEEGAVLMHLLDIILPKTDTPSATDVNVHKFIDKYLDEVSPEEEQKFMKMGMGKFIEKALADSGKESALDLGAEELEPLLAAALEKKEAEEEAAIFESLMSYNEAVANGEPAELDGDVARYAFATQLRDGAISAYKNSEYIGEEVLAYLQIPGGYIGCGDLDELSGGRAWSL